MQTQLDVKIVTLPALHVVSCHGFGEGPEDQAHQKLKNWAERHQSWAQTPTPRVFGFNNPNPMPGNSQYGYEIWLQVPPTTQAEEGYPVKDFAGGRYAVLRIQGVENIMQAWQSLTAWVETSPYRPGQHQWLEEHILFRNLPIEEYVLDLYFPIQSE